MFNSGIKVNQSFRNNGVYPPPASEPPVVIEKSVYQTNLKRINKLDRKELYSTRKYGDRHFVPNPIHYTNLAVQASNYVASGQVAGSLDECFDFEDKIAVHSIIGVSDPKTHKPKVIEHKIKKEIKKEKSRATHHEALQRIEPILRETTEVDVQNYYQQHWFSASLEKLKSEDRSREERIEITRHEFLRHIQQIKRSNVGKPNKMPEWLERRKKEKASRKSRSNVLVAAKYCEVQDCDKPALCLANHCSLHILLDTRQVLFEHCKAKFADNTQCSTPVFDITQELPLCTEHARKRENYRLYQEAKPKKIRKKVKPSAMTRPQKRSKKKKRPPAPKPVQEPSLNSAILGQNIPISENALVNEIELDEVESPELEEDIEQVLALNENGLEQVLANQGHLLEESDEINNVLSTITVDEFTDFFGINRNGEPSREEAEELEKALAAVNDDVKSLEKLSLATPGLLDSLLDEHALADTLVQIPDMFHNGYNSCGDSVVAQTSSFLLPIEPHSHS